MQKTNGIFDNRETMQREAWKDDELAGQWPAAMCARVPAGRAHGGIARAWVDPVL